MLCCCEDVSATDTQVFRVLGREGINVKMMSQGASKTNISLIVSDNEGQRAVEAIHDEFFGAPKVVAAPPARVNGNSSS